MTLLLKNGTDLVSQIAVGQYYWRLRRMISVTRGGLIGLVYEQSLNLDLNDPSANPLAALTHANGDTDAAQQALYQAHDLWSSIVEIVVADYLIWRQMGAACAIPIAVAVGKPDQSRVFYMSPARALLIGNLAAVIASGFLAAPTGSALAVWLLALQQRVVKTAQTLGSIKWIKMSGLGDAAFTTIRDLRTHELKVSLKYRLLVGGSMIISMLLVRLEKNGSLLTWISSDLRTDMEPYPDVQLLRRSRREGR